MLGISRDTVAESKEVTSRPAMPFSVASDGFSTHDWHPLRCSGLKSYFLFWKLPKLWEISWCRLVTTLPKFGNDHSARFDPDFSSVIVPNFSAERFFIHDRKQCILVNKDQSFLTNLLPPPSVQSKTSSSMLVRNLDESKYSASPPALRKFYGGS